MSSLTTDAMAQDVQLRIATFDDYKGMAYLERRHALKTRTYDEWKHFWVNNPVYNALDFAWPIGWVLESSEGIVGSFSNIPLRYMFAGQPLLAATGRAWVTDERYRSYSILLLNEFLSQPKVKLFLCTTVNRHAENTLSALNLQRVPGGAWDKSGFWVTNYLAFARSVLAMRSKGFRIPLSLPYSTLPLAKDKWWTKVWPPANKYRPVHCLSNFDERFDEFWTELKSRNTSRLLADRSRAVLDWHFRRAIQRGRIWILAVTDPSSRLRAYLIVSRKDKAEFGLSRMRIIDFQSIEDDPSALISMLAWACRRCRQERICVLENIGWALKPGGVMDALTPHKRRLAAWQFFYKAGGPELERLLENEGAWPASLFDGDSSL